MSCHPPEVLTHGEQGYLAICRSCNNFSLAFGTTLMVLEHSELDTLQEMLEDEIYHNRSLVCPNEKCFHMYLLPNKKYSLVMTYAEMEVLLKLIAEGKLINQAYQIANEH